MVSEALALGSQGFLLFFLFLLTLETTFHEVDSWMSI